MDVEQHGARRIGIVGGMYTTACEFPDKPCLDGSHQQFTLRSLFASSFYVIQQPLDACRREVGVNQQSTLVEYLLGHSLATQFATKLSTTGILPDHSIGNRLACRFIPYDSRLSLVGNSQ